VSAGSGRPIQTGELGDRPRILLVRLSSIGDVIVATPAIAALRAAFPQAHLAWLVEEKSADIVRGNPALDEVIVWERAATSRHGRMRALREHLDFARRLRERRFDVAIDFQGLLRSALLVGLSGARWRIASEGSREGSRLFYNVCVPRSEDPSSRQRCLDVLQPLGVESRDRRMVVWFGPEHAAAAGRLAARARAEVGGTRLVCLCPATTWRHKHWREEGWGALADGLARDGATPVFMGAASDRPMLERIRKQMRERAFHVAGETSLKEAAALLARAALAITVDTGLMHSAVAVGAPVVALCGPSYWPGFEDYEGLHMLRKPFPCSPCLRRPTCANDDCMTAITSGEVLAVARAVLSGLPILPASAPDAA
jgi:heptosyltransferase-1